MKPQERALLLAVAQTTDVVQVRRLCEQMGVPKQNWYYLEKWAGKGWYDYGVCVDLGWLTPEGKAAAIMARAINALTPPA